MMIPDLSTSAVSIPSFNSPNSGRMKRDLIFLDNIDMEIARSDQIQKQIVKEVCARKKLLAKNLKRLRAQQDKNELLDGVVKDYEKYHAFILSEKEKKKKAFLYIIQYLDKIMTEGKLTESDLRETKHEYNKILGDLGNVRQQLDELMELTSRET